MLSLVMRSVTVRRADVMNSDLGALIFDSDQIIAIKILALKESLLGFLDSQNKLSFTGDAVVYPYHSVREEVFDSRHTIVARTLLLACTFHLQRLLQIPSCQPLP